MVKELREKTGAGMMDCKNALAEADGDMEKAVDELRKRGQAIATKAGARAAKEGLIFSKVDGKLGVLLELNCVTDFVALGDDFRALGATLAGMVFAGGPAVAGGRLADLLEATHPSAGKPVREVLTDMIAKTGENMTVSRFVRVEAAPAGVVTGYIHPPGKLGVLVELRTGKAETLANPAVRQLAADLTMQVAAAAPVALDKGAVPADLIERERAIYRDQVKMEGKPEKIWDKIVEGKLAKFYKDSCLLEQAFIRDGDLSIAQVIESVAKKVGDAIGVVRFVRFVVGGAEPKTAEE
jgi:elongation factor Ts